MKIKLIKFLHSPQLIIVIATTLALIYTYQFVLVNHYSIGIPDALARMNIARRLIDNLTPGIAQLGSVWLPIPQILYAPLVQIDLLYKTGIGAALVSGTLFVIGAIYIFKTMKLFTNNLLAIYVPTIAYITSNNLLYFQTTAMSEAAIITFIIMSAYHLLAWSKRNEFQHLLFGALSIVLVTLTRYEGYAVHGLACVIVLVIALLKNRNRSATEGITIIFGTLASVGIGMWTLYSALIFKDPIYWLHVYTNSRSILSNETLTNAGDISTTTGLDTSFSIESFVTSLRTLFFAIVEMNGLIYLLLGTIGVLIGTVYVFIRRKYQYLPLIILLGPLLFLIANLLGSSVPIIAPEFTIQSITEKGFFLKSEYNIRYGIQLLPLLIIGIGVLCIKLKNYSLIVLILVLIQFVSVFTNYNLIFALQKRPPEIFSKYGPSIEWFNNNYDEGQVLASVLANDSIMFHMDIPYKKFIFEGNGDYWLDSLQDPTKYATWVIFKNIPNNELSSFTDRVGYHLQNSDILLNNYNLVYEGELLIYKIKTQPQIQL